MHLIEQKMELKYYCSLCDCVNFSSLYHKSHLNSKLHKKNIINNNDISQIDFTDYIENELFTLINSNKKRVNYLGWFSLFLFMPNI